MDFKKMKNTLTGIMLFVVAMLFIIGCSDKAKSSTDNTFYIEMVNFTKDSLKQQIEDNIFGKVSYYKNNKVEILSLNYVTEDFPEMHYFKNAEGMDKEIKPGTRKVKIEFAGEYNIDSISYSLQKFIYKNKQWNKISDMGFMKATTTYKKAKEYAIEEFSKQIVNSVVAYTYN